MRVGLVLMTLALAISIGVRMTMKKASGQTMTEKIIAEWNFDKDGDLEGWQANAHLTDVQVKGGVLSFRGIGSDPILEFRPLLDIPASPFQVIEIRMKADRDGVAEFFWSNTTEPPYSGFRPGKQTPFTVIGDGQWRTYRISPFWHPEGKIIRLRFDPYDGANFVVDFIRIVEMGQGARDMGQVKNWQPVGEMKVTPERDRITVVLQSPDAFLLSPPLDLDGEKQTFVSVRMAVAHASIMRKIGKMPALHTATLFFASEKLHGLHSVSFPIIADGKERTYNLDMLAEPNWKGRIIALGLRPTDAVGAKVRVRWLKVSDEPQGPAELKVRAFALEDTLLRVGIPTTLVAIVTNVGGEPARNVRASATFGGRRLLPAPTEISAGDRASALHFGEETEFRFRIVCQRPTSGDVVLKVSADNAEPVTVRTRLTFTRRIAVPKTGYVPEPKPVRGKYDVGVYYFPGWKSWSQWFPISRFPERKPILGWYREGDPEVADWHIKWAVEHGITFFAYDWYWCQGARMLEHALHDGYLKSRYRHLLKFCLLWANHNPPKTSSLEDCIAVTRYWIENYFRLPEYFTIEGKPVVIIFSTHRLTEDLGSDGVRKAFEAMRQECLNHGLKGLYLMACVSSAGHARQAAQEGYDAVTAYNWPGLGMKAGERWSPFDVLIDAYRRNWEHIAEQSPIPLMLPVCGGWDSRPWHGDNALVRFGRNPENFRRHLQDAKAFLSSHRPAVLPIIIIEAWNEWGEGSYIEPHVEFGFGYLDAIREVFTNAPKAHTDITPADVGLGRYEVTKHAPTKTAWEFEGDDEGWSSWMNLSDVRVERGCLVAKTVGNDPAFFGPPIQARASEFPFVIVQMRLQSEDKKPFTDVGQLFWQTQTVAESEATSVRFEVIGDGQWHEYRLPVHQNRRWRGIITRLRLDPCARAGVLVELDSIRLMR